MRLSPLAVVVIFLMLGCLNPPVETPDYALLQAMSYAARHPFPDLVVEIDYVEGRAPHPGALAALEATLNEVVDKRSITILEPTEIPPPPETERKQDRPRVAHASSFDSMPAANLTYGQGSTAYLHVIYLDGIARTTEGSHLLGLHIGQAVILYPDAWRGQSREPVRIDDSAERKEFELERAVLIHEIGHAFGLVDGGAPMVRPHSDGTGHSSNRGSVMYAEVDRPGSLLSLLQREEIPFRFDTDDLADLRALQELARQNAAAAAAS